jgi:hypothetical protein
MLTLQLIHFPFGGTLLCYEGMYEDEPRYIFSLWILFFAVMAWLHGRLYVAKPRHKGIVIATLFASASFSLAYPTLYFLSI